MGKILSRWLTRATKLPMLSTKKLSENRYLGQRESRAEALAIVAALNAAYMA